MHLAITVGRLRQVDVYLSCESEWIMVPLQSQQPGSLLSRGTQLSSLSLPDVQALEKAIGDLFCTFDCARLDVPFVTCIILLNSRNSTIH